MSIHVEETPPLELSTPGGGLETDMPIEPSVAISDEVTVVVNSEKLT